MTDTCSNAQLLGQMLAGSWTTPAIYVAAELGIADLLAKGPQTPEELADRTGSHRGALCRVLRALASIGIFAEDSGGRFCLTPLADRLRSDAPGSQRWFAIMMGAEFYQSWGNLLFAVQTGEDAFRKTFGASFFDYMTRHPERHRIYDAAMEGIHGLETEPVLDAYDFSSIRTVVDVGGGNGSTLAAILKRYPAMKGILFELPAVADRAAAVVAGLGLDGRCRIVGGDFFSSVPAGADAYVMRHVIHDWDDEEAAAILRNCREAMAPGGKILVLENVIQPGNGPGFGKWLDLMMLVVSGRERTEEQYRHLFRQAGLSLSRVVPTTAGISVVEGMRAT